MSEDEALDPAAIGESLRGQLIGNRVLHFQQATSTNDIVRRLANGSTEGLIVLAERQTSGRGQYGRHWESPARKGLYLSILLRPEILSADTSILTAWAAETISATLRRNYSLGALVKLPNDVYVEERKVAGVLLEMRAVEGAAHYGILGLGVNVNQTLAEFPESLRQSAASVAMLTGTRIDRQALVIDLLRNLNRTYAWSHSN